MAIAALVSGVTAYLPAPPGMESSLVLVGTVAAIAGSAIGILVDEFRALMKILLVVVILMLCIYAINQFRSIAGGEPGREASNILLFWAAVVFAPIGFVIELAGLSFADK
ncbi:hypothetical protein JJB99_32815 [Bradyrhizobium diazoefficiens]|uniref:hypothetical protein n=1 Tax=Bradyrhizobium diazoefficiens TaxID=1355477 RepID=UPI001909AA35|nr:hypothetical protein [Bradyrhizobium diazoefficiens]QQO14043.1 hypothetical protein JJB99_32815 [Bradyrhizobium diazoefficiens]